jgi:GNAT superfamily N-acetyltransferase
MPREKFWVRKATRKDVPELLKLLNEWYVEDGDRPVSKLSDSFVNTCFGRTRSHHVVVAEGESGLVGMAHAYPVFDPGEEEPILGLENLFVTKGKRRNGIGAKLMSAISRLAKQEGASGVCWMVNGRSRRAMRFYASQGAERSDYVPMFLVGRSLSARARSVKAV